MSFLSSGARVEREGWVGRGAVFWIRDLDFGIEGWRMSVSLRDWDCAVAALD